eukprot:TRINITY_DN146393_c0_g1_i1.p1 TRINITY_DN146393_c0_g1~~TRINITY_DN146393_c0_g1_i1.p1  ORF type:complete len:105 (+),score=3.98 TRINITY_DN146393_c0_g1_i1:2-316(+)
MRQSRVCSMHFAHIKEPAATKRLSLTKLLWSKKSTLDKVRAHVYAICRHTHKQTKSCAALWVTYFFPEQSRISPINIYIYLSICRDKDVIVQCDYCHHCPLDVL